MIDTLAFRIDEPGTGLTPATGLAPTSSWRQFLKAAARLLMVAAAVSAVALAAPKIVAQQVTFIGVQSPASTASFSFPVHPLAITAGSSSLSIGFNPAAVGIAQNSAQTLQASFSVSGYSGSFTPTAAMHYGHDYTVGAATCTSTGSSTETCTFPITFIPTLPGTRKDAIVISNGSTILTRVLVYGLGQAPMAAFTPGIVNSVSVGSAYAYHSKVDENGVDYLVVNGGLHGVYTSTKAGVLGQIVIPGAPAVNAVAVDGAGTLYVLPNGYSNTVTTYTTDGLTGSIQIVPPSPCSNSSGGSLEYLYDVVVDGAGDIYVLDIVCNQVYERKLDGSVTALTISPSITQPSQLAVDDAGNVFISGYTINESVSGGAQTQVNAVGAGDGLAVDAAGILYATRYIPSSSTFPYGVAELLPSDYSTASLGVDTGYPLGLGLGSDGTVYVGNYNNLDIVDRSQGKIDFGSMSSGATSATKSIQVLNTGNQPLTVSSLVLTGSDYTLHTTGSQDCANGSVIPAGAYCQVSVSVTPAQGGNNSGSLTLTTNSLNTVSTQVSNFTAQVNGINVTPNPSSVSFPAQAINTTSTAQTVTMTNQGLNASAGYTSITSNNSAFTATQGTCTGTVQPGSSCQISITFTPTAVQSYSGTVTVTWYASGGLPSQQVVLNVSGTVATPQPVLSASALTFADTNAGSSSASQTFTLSNNGTGSLAISAITLGGANPAAFTQTNTCGSTLAASASCNITVTFTPASGGTFNATVNIADNATGSPQTVALSGNGIALTPQAVVNPTTLSFPNTTVGVSSTAQTVTLSNHGNASLSISAIGIAGTNAGSFSQTNNCGSSVAAGASCTLSVIFTPASAASLSAVLSITDNATGSPHTVALGGTGTQTSAPQAALSPSSLAFPNTTVGISSTAQTVTLSNRGNASLNISAIGIAGTNAGSFSQTNNCGSSVAAGASCTLSVIFTPASAAALSAMVSIADNATGSPHTIALSGTGTPVPVPQAVLSPSSLTFPNTTVGSASAAQTLTLTNPGNAALSISGISLTGTNPADFSQTNSCGASLAAGASCTITVTYTPGSLINSSASISIADNASGSPQTASLSGTGGASPNFTTSSSTPAQTVTAGGSTQFVFSIQPQAGAYIGTVAMSVSGLPQGATASFQPASFSVGSSTATTTLTIQTTPRQHARNTPAPWPFSPGEIAIALVAPFCLRRMRRGGEKKTRSMLLGISLAAAFAAGAACLTGCGGGLVFPSSSPTPYTITVTATNSTAAHSTTVSLIVQ